LDLIQFQLGTSTAQTTTGAGFDATRFSSYLYNSTVGAEQHFGNVFLSVNTGFCTLATGQGFNARDNVGAKAEYRFDPRLSMSLSYDPGTSNRSCNATQDFINFVRTPSQFSFSLSHTFRF